MKSKLTFILLFALINWRAYSQDTIILNPSVKFQTIEGWGHGGGILGHTNAAFTMLDSGIANPVNYEILDYLVDDLGLTGSRITEVGPRTDGTGMDHGDCDNIDWTRFDATSLPAGEAAYLVYYKNKIVAEGFQPSFYSSTGYATNATSQKPWVMNHPGERAQQIWADAVYMRDTLGININYDVIYNEPSGTITSTILANDIKALGPRFISHGLNTKSQYAEAVSPQTDWNFITPVQNDSDLWQWVGRLSYHNYGTADPYRADIYNFGLTKGLTTAQTEMESPTFDELYSDLTIANTSYWEVAYSASNTLVPASGLTSFTPSVTFFRMRQVLHYVKPGSVRIGLMMNDSLLHVLAFNRNKKKTIIIDNISSTIRSIHLSGLPAGTYGLSQSPPGATGYQEFGLRTVGTNGTIDFNVNPGGVVTTLYPYTSPNNPPDIMTWTSNPGYLVLPSTTAIISATASDAELNTLTYQWTVSSHPKGSNPVIASPNVSSSSVSGLTKTGTYIFKVSVSDGINTSSKKLYVISYSSNPPPVPGSAGFRIAPPYGLIFSNPGVETHANIELPISAVTLQIGISDLANSDFTGRGTWSLVKQPAGANVTISATTYIYISIRAMVTGMTVPGDYIFQVNITNPGHPDLKQRIKCTVHPASSPPVINSITASQSILTLPVDSLKLTVKTSDPEGDLLRHWWVIKSAPSGAKPVFNHQGLKVSEVSGLSLPGTYIFTLRCFDDLHMTVKDDTINVYSCAQPTTGFSTSNITATSAKIHWDTISAAIGYKVEYKKSGTTTWTIKTVSTNNGFKTLTGLLPSTKYQWRVETNCIADPDIFSSYSVINTFTTTASLVGAMATAGITEGSISEIRLFPNPAHNTIMLSFKTDNRITYLQIINSLGQVIMQKEIISNKGEYEQQLDISKLAAGVYALRLQTENKSAAVSFVKN